MNKRKKKGALAGWNQKQPKTFLSEKKAKIAKKVTRNSPAKGLDQRFRKPPKGKVKEKYAQKNKGKKAYFTYE